jgi:hypothetical protein
LNEELKIIISAEISKLKQGIENAKNSVKTFQDKVKEASKNVDDKFKTMGSSIATGAKAMATGLAAGTTALLALGASTAEYRAEQARLISAFEAAGSTAEQAKTTYSELQRVLGDSGAATEAAQHLANVTTEEKALGEYTTILQGVWASYGSSLPLEGLAEAIGHSSALGEVQGSLADSLEWAGISTDSFNEKLSALSTQEEREKLIRETLNSLYGEAASVYEKNNAEVLKQNEAQARLQETTAALGEAVAPVVTAFTNFANEALAALLPYIQGLAENYMPQLKAALEGVAEGLASTFEWVQQHSTLLATIAGVITGLVAAIGLYNAVAAVKAAMDAAQVTTLAGLASAYIAQAAAMAVAIAPYALIVAAIAAVIAIIVTCIKHWDKITEATKKAWDKVQQATEKTVSKVVSKYSEMKNKAQQYFNAMGENAGTIFASITKVIESNIQTALSVIKNILGLIKSVFKGDLEGVKQSAANILNALTDNFRTKLNAAKDIVKSALSAIKNVFSSSKWELPRIKLPHFSITGTFSLNPPQIPKISVSWYKLGGVFDSPTLFPYGNGSIGGLGEAGAEAIVPLENNLGWLDKLATMLNEKMGGKTPIVLNVDGKVFAETAISTINRQTRQTGKLALNLV